MKDEFVIISNEDSLEQDFIDDTGVLVCFYYEESYERYIDRILDISEIVNVYIVSSNQSIINSANKVIEQITKSKNLHLIEKNNRGRDISSLLVAAKHITKKYMYICFCHDKASKNEHTREFALDWEATLFDNTLYNKRFVKNAVKYLKDNMQVGLMIPPEPIGKYHYFDYWLDNYENTYKLARELHLNVTPDKSENPIAIGTAFWAKSDALRKLFDYNWTYESFLEEPLPSDGTISHAVERIFPYVAMDAGYTTSILMNIDYATKQLSEKKDELEQSTRILEKEFGVLTARQLRNFYEKIENIKGLRLKCDKLYIYGTGLFGGKCYKLLSSFNIKIDGFVETKKNKDSFLEKNVKSIGEIEDCGIIVAVSESYVEEVLGELSERNINKYVCF